MEISSMYCTYVLYILHFCFPEILGCSKVVDTLSDIVVSAGLGG